MLDKQEAYQGRLKVADGKDDTIMIRLTIETFGKGILEEEVTKLFFGKDSRLIGAFGITIVFNLLHIKGSQWRMFR